MSAARTLKGVARAPSAAAAPCRGPRPTTQAAAPPISAIPVRTGRSRGSTAGLTAPARTAIRTHMSVEASTAADAIAGRPPAACERCAIAIVTAVLDTRPPTAAVSVIPRRSPRTRIATKPMNESPDTSATTIQISCGSSAAHGP